MNIPNKLKAKRAFLKKGTCSRTFFYLLNKEFGNPNDDEERAIDPLAGGILQQGYQCGMLWGASMAVGKEAYRRNKNLDEVISSTIVATQHIMESFVNRTKSIECADVTKTDFSNNWSFAKYMLSGKFTACFRLAGRWAPEAVKAAKEGLDIKQNNPTTHPISCASEVVKKMGGSDEEIAMVSGFAGGLGLSGNGCGALAAAIWKNSLTKHIKLTGKSAPYKPETNEVLQKFHKETDYEMECSVLCGRKFSTIEEHTEFIKNGGCSKLINLLANV